jgi:endonuclease G
MKLTLAVLCTLIASPALAAPACPQFFADGQPPTLLNQKLEARTTTLCNDAYAVLASGVTRGALWSAEHLTTDSLAKAAKVKRAGTFHAETRLPVKDRAQLKDYVRSGYDRGHMTPSGDAPTSVAQQQTFSLANMVPQVGTLNRGAWERIETAVRRMAREAGELYVVTGAAFQGDNLQSIGSGVLVPTSTWKAVYGPRTGAAGAYICTNVAAPSCSTVSIAQLIVAVGVDPFPTLSDATKQATIALPMK